MKTAMIASSLAGLALVTFGWFDTASYRVELQGYQTLAREPLQQLRQQVQQDEARYQRCDFLRAENPATRTVDFTPDGRACLIDALDQAASFEGTLVLLRNASVALARNPGDQALRTAALGAVARARVTLASQRSWLHDRLERVQNAQAASAVMRLFGQLPAPGLRFEQQAAQLDLAEYAIHLPALHQSQQIWRLEARLPAKG